MMRTFSLGMAKAALSTCTGFQLIWVASQRVSLSSSHSATVAEVSIGLWLRVGWNQLWVRLTSDAAMP